MLESGCYRIKVAEEGALLVIAWLLTQQKIQEAEEIMTHIQVSPCEFTARATA